MARLASGIVLTLATFMTATAAEPVSYGRDVRPILSENCFYCHGQDANKRQADLQLNTQAGQRAEGVVVPGKPDESELVKRILSADASTMMPPPKSNRKLSDAQKATLKRWIAEGAKFDAHWAYLAPTRPAVPVVNGVTNPIDAFLRARLATTKLTPSPEADKEKLIRRVTLDLTGLPPAVAEIDAFVKDTSPKAFETVVDRLLASKHYGERMALPWLDAARYADSNGFQQDGDTFQWIWRDWVVNALNTNMPFDQFTVEQLAGDLLPNATVSQKIATAFNRNHLINGEGGAIPEEQRFNILFDRVDTTATNWLGLTMACAQCHDHKYDPITQRDYYSLLATFNNVSETGTAGRQSATMRVSVPFLEVGSDDDKASSAKLDKAATALKTARDKKQKEWEAKVITDKKSDDPTVQEILSTAKTTKERDQRMKEYFDTKIDAKLAGQLQKAEEAAAKYRNDHSPRVMVMADDKPRESHILDRGEYLKKKEPVTFNTPMFLPPLPKGAPRNRLGLSKWLVSPEHPLTARVAVNRAWQTFFGVGLVKTSEDFGVQSETPLHQDLLDWLAVEFRESGWDVKRLHKLIVMSNTYRQSSKITTTMLAEDPENRLYARFPRTRLPAMTLRDIALSTSGLLDDRFGGKPVYPYQPDGIWETLAITKERDFTYPKSHGADLYRRSLYTFWRRTVGPANMFDASTRQVCKVKPSVTNTPLHALTTLNDPTWVEASRVLAGKTLAVEGFDARMTFVYRRVLGRTPTPKEVTVLRKMLDEQAANFTKDEAGAEKLLSVGESPLNDTLDIVEHAAWTNLCLALFNLDEALTRE
ncbi:DUF1553 domain-containing protein [soil metagenome]